MLADALRSGGFPVLLEITPPRETQPRVLLRRARMLGARPAAVHVIQREKRQPSVEAASELLAAGIEPVWHLATRGRSRASIAAELERAGAAGLRNVLCLRGDHAAADPPAAPSLREVVERACEALPGGLIGATLNPYLPREPVLRNLVGKLAAGADYVLTQPLFELAPLVPFAEPIRERFPAARIVAMTLPLLSREEARRIASRLGIPLPHREFDMEGDAGGWRSFENLLRELRESPLIDAVAIMTLAMDPSPETAGRIASALERSAGAG